jgi:hypothetical protein
MSKCSEMLWSITTGRRCTRKATRSIVTARPGATRFVPRPFCTQHATLRLNETHYDRESRKYFSSYVEVEA